MIKLRPHHLLCMQSFRGKGYSPSFVMAMQETIDTLRKEPQTIIDLEANFDSICASCPKKDGPCRENDGVVKMDRKVLERFSLTEGEMAYEKALAQVYTAFTEEDFEYICQSCSWYAQGYCRQELLGFAEFFKLSSSML